MNRFIKGTLKAILWGIGALLMLLVLLVFLLRLPAVQNYIIHQAVLFVSRKTHTRIQLNRLYLGLPKTIVLENLYAEDTRHDTLLAVQKLEVEIDLFGLLDKKVKINSVLLSGATAYVNRNTDSAYNFEFLIKAFSSENKKAVAVKNTVKTDIIAWQIQVNRVELKNIRGGFSDSVGGTTLQGFVGGLNLDMKTIDLKQQSFNGNELSLINADVRMVQNKQGAETPDTSITLMPLLSLNKLQLQEVSFVYENKVNSQLYSIQAGKALVLPGKIDLNGHIIRVKQLDLEQTSAKIAIRRNPVDTTKARPASPGKPGVPWQISGVELKLAMVNFSLDITNVPKLKSGVDYNHLSLINTNIDISEAFYSPTQITGKIHNISFKEKSGFELKKLSAQVLYNDKHAQVQGLMLLTNRSEVGNNLGISYSSINHIAKDVGELGVNGNFKNTHVAIEDILFFAPQLKNQSIIVANRGKTITLNGKISGKVKDLTAVALNVGLSGGTSTAFDAHIKGLPDALNAFYNLSIKDFRSTAIDLDQLTGGKIPHSVNVPQNMALSGTVKGTIKNATARLSLKTSSGNADIEATLGIQPSDTFYNVTLQTHALNLGYILKLDTLLGPLSMNATIKGHNISPAAIQADLIGDIQSMQLNKYNYTNFSVKTSANRNHYGADLFIRDSALVMTLQASASLVIDSQFINVNGHIDGADLQKLKLLKENIRTSGYLAVNLSGPIENLNGTARLNDIIVVKEKDSYHIDSFVVTSLNDYQHSALGVKSPVVNADYNGNIKIQNLPTTIIHHVNQYFKLTNDSVLTSTDTTDQHFKMSVNVLPHPIIAVVLPGLQDFEGADITSSFNKNTDAFKFDANISSLAYKSIKAADVHANISADNKAIKYSVSLQSLETGPVRLAETSLSGSLADNVVQYALRIHGKDTIDRLMIAGNFKQDSIKTYVLHIDNKGLVLDNDKWDLAEDNYIRYGSKGLVFHNILLSNKEQQLSINTRSDNLETIKIKFNKFQVGSLSQIIERDTALLRGTIDGSVELRNIYHTPAFVSSLEVNDIVYRVHPIGNLSLHADNLSADKYSAQLTLNGFANDVTAKGYYSAVGDNNQLNFKVDIRKLNVSSVEPFTAGQIRRSSGYLTGSFTVTGAAKQPVITGDIGFKDVAFNLAYINNFITLKDERISVDSKGIYFQSFNILDSLKQKASISGAINTSDFKKMNFDISMTTDHFTVLNTTIKDNSLFFGKVILNSDIRVTGNELLPIVRVNAKLLDGSHIAVVIPSSKINVDRGEGVVVLTDTSTINNLMNPKDTLTLANGFKGIDLSANLEVTKETTFKVIVDKSSGDSLAVRGNGVLSFTMDETGNQSLTGTYNLESGSYRASFQKVIKRELKIQHGGSIIWNGSPTDATVDINAIYTVKTSPADLLSSELASSTTGERNAYNNLLNFNVLMSMKGELLRPEISFKLDMDLGDQNVLGGTVYAKVTSINNDPSELNKQVFALLVMGKFIPATIGGGGSGAAGTNYGDMASNLARTSVNQVLTNELNALSGRFIKGVDINVGINANDQYTGTGVTQNTQLSASLKKSFFKERLSVQVGTSVNVQNDNGALKGADAQSLTGDIVLEYKVNKDGSLRFKAFRQNQYNDFIDGTITDTGVGIVYNRDYNKFKELFTRHKKEKPVEPTVQKKNE